MNQDRIQNIVMELNLNKTYIKVINHDHHELRPKLLAYTHGSILSHRYITFLFCKFEMVEK